MSLNYFTDVSKGVKLGLKIGCDEFKGGALDYATVSWSGVPTNLVVPVIGGSGLNVVSQISPTTSQTNKVDRFDATDPNGIKFLKGGIYHVQVSIALYKTVTNDVLYLVKDDNYPLTAEGHSQTMPVGELRLLSMSWMERYEAGNVVAPLLCNVGGDANPFQATAYTLYVRYLSEE